MMPALEKVDGPLRTVTNRGGAAQPRPALGVGCKVCVADWERFQQRLG